MLPSTPEKSPTLTAPDGVALVPQPHGGALKRGGRHANSGPPRSALRDVARVHLEARIPWLAAVSRGDEVEDHVTPEGEIVTIRPRTGERIRATELLAKIAGVATPPQQPQTGVTVQATGPVQVVFAREDRRRTAG